MFTNDVMTSYKWREADLQVEAGSAFLRRFYVNIMEFWFNKHVDSLIIRINPVRHRFSVILALEIRCFDSIFHLASLGEK